MGERGVTEVVLGRVTAVEGDRITRIADYGNNTIPHQAGLTG